MKQSVKPSTPRKKYDCIFKQDAVQIWRASGKSATLKAEELGLKAIQLLDENTALRQELEQMRQ